MNDWTRNSLVSHNMILGDSVQEISVADFEVSSNSQFDLGTVQMTLNQLSLGEGSTISVTLNGLSEHAVVKGQQINSAAAAVLDLNLGDNFEAGLYQIFYMNEIMSLPQVNYNGDDYQILDMKDGRYSFISTNSNEVASTFGSDENETKAILALHKGTSENQEFNKMQAELIDYLQSDNKEAKQKAVESVNAVGGDIKPIIQTVSFEHFNSISNAVQTQSVKAMNAKTGRAGGDEAPRSVVWGKAFYSHTKNSSNGNYKINGTGGILALQTQVTDSLILGAGYSYSHADVKQTFRETIAQNNAGFIYLKYQPSNWFVDGIASYMRGQYEEDKYILSTSASANYNVDVLGLQGILGYDYTYKNLVLTPKFGLSYMRLNQEAYTDSLGTTVDNLSSDYMTVMLGLDIDAPMKTVKGFKVRPMAGVMFGYDIITDDMSVTNTLSNGASYTVKGEALDRLSSTVTTGLEAELSDRTSLKLEYSGTFRKEYQDHSGMLKLEMRF